MLDALGLRGKVALVTGGGRGIGAACARQLAAHGADLVLVGRTESRHLIALTEELSSTVSVTSFASDVRDPDGISSLYKAVRAEYGRLDVLVNNAGVLDDALVGMIRPEMIDDVLRVNTVAPILHLQAAVRMMRKNGGSIINMSSIIGRNGNVGQTVYAASKAALLGMTYSAAKELAASGIRVNAIAPGFIETDMTAALPPEKYQERLDSIAMKRIGTPDDVARVALFLASDLAAYVTGQVIGVDGGMLI